MLARPATVALLFASLTAGAPAWAAPSARFPVQPAGRGAQRLDVPPAFVAASAKGDLSDLRLRDGSGREVPYLLVSPPEQPPRWAPVQRIRPLAQTKTESGAELDLGSVQTVGALEVTFREHGFLKRARVEGSADGARYAVLADGDTLYDLPLDPEACGADPCDGPLVRRELRFAPAKVRWLRLVLDDRRSARLGLPREARAQVSQTRSWSGPVTPVEVQPRPGEPGVSRFVLRLPGPHLPIVAVRLEVEAPRLARRARVLEARLSGPRLVPFELGSGMLVRVERDGAVASSLRIPVSAPEELELELVVDDGDNPPLALRGASVELAPLPWIYFESADGAALEASLGDRTRHAPRYDLEALRPELDRLAPAVAKVGAALAPPAEQPSEQVADPVGPGAPLDPKPFHVARSVAAAPAGLAAVGLDAAVLAESDLADLRLRAPDGRQLPYLLEARDEPLPVSLAPGPAPAGLPEAIVPAGFSAHVLALPQPRFPGCRLVLETGARVFTRAVHVYVRAGKGTGHDSQAKDRRHRLDPFDHDRDRDRRGLTPVASVSWTHADPNRATPPLTIDLPEVQGRELLVTFDDGDNAPLPLTGARLLLPGYRLRFFHPGQAIQLLYGARVEAPRYDLELIAPRLRAAPAREVALGQAAGPATRAPERQLAAAGPGRIVFWIVLGLAVAALLALVARLVVRGTPPPPA